MKKNKSVMGSNLLDTMLMARKYAVLNKEHEASNPWKEISSQGR